MAKQYECKNCCEIITDEKYNGLLRIMGAESERQCPNCNEFIEFEEHKIKTYDFLSEAEELWHVADGAVSKRVVDTRGAIAGSLADASGFIRFIGFAVKAGDGTITVTNQHRWFTNNDNDSEFSDVLHEERDDATPDIAELVGVVMKKGV
jgi:hypothetical protein